MSARVLPILPPLLFALLAACGGGGGPAAMPSNTAPRYTLSMLANNETAGAIVLYHAQFAEPFTDVQTLTVSVSPAPPAGTQVSWTTSNAVAVTVQAENPDYATPAPTAPPFGIFAGIGHSYGAATITATVGPPVDQSVSLPAYSYDSVAFGCTFRNTPAFDFDPFSVAYDTNADLYDSIGSDMLHQLDPCLNTAFATAPGTPEIWHVPNGGTIVQVSSIAQFASVQASQWQNAATEFPAQQAPTYSVLLLKTKSGRTAKIFMPLGPFEVSGANGAFPY